MKWILDSEFKTCTIMDRAVMLFKSVQIIKFEHGGCLVLIGVSGN